MKMDAGLDTGPMLLKRELGIAGKTAGQVTEEMANLGAQALLQWLEKRTPPQPQPDEGVTYAAKIDKAEARIDWSRTADEIERKVRAFAPSPGSWFEANGERLKLLQAEVTEGSGRPGEMLDDRLRIATASAAIRPLRLQRAGRVPMTPEELLRGFPIPAGTILQ
jgi:methionyl-tRNA formyltransferase